MKVYQAIAAALRDLGVTTLFGLMGDANVLYVAEYRELPDTAFVNSVIEGGAVSMADGYARFSGKVGVVSVTHGPALANTLTALIEAVRARTPLVLITGDTPGQVRDHFQVLDINAFASLAGAGYVQVREASECVEDVALAFHLAASQHRAVVLNIPVDFLTAEVSYSRPPIRARNEAGFGPADDSDELDAALGVIASARRPLIIGGRGAAGETAKREILRLGDLTGAALGTSLLGKDLFDGHPFSVGIVGTLGHSLSVDIAAQSDCVIAFGASLNKYTTNEGTLFDGRRVIQCDISPDRLARYGPADIQLLGDAAVVAKALADRLEESGIRNTGFRTDSLRAAIAAIGGHDDFVARNALGKVDMRSAMVALDAVLPDDRIVVTDSGRFIYAPWRYLHVPKAGDFAHTISFGSIGLGLGTAIGAAFAQPMRTVVLVVGDGGGMMTIAELQTACRYGLKLIMVVLNDGCYGAEYTKLQSFNLDPAHALLEWPSFAEVAAALGAESHTVSTLGELEDLAVLTEAPKRPVLVDVRCDPAVDIA
jgi:acetolactate synthase-1/2/3 large subunit